MSQSITGITGFCTSAVSSSQDRCRSCEETIVFGCGRTEEKSSCSGIKEGIVKASSNGSAYCLKGYLGNDMVGQMTSV